MFRNPRPLDAFDGVNWGSEAKLKLTTPKLIHEIVIDGPTDASLVEYIKVEIDGDPVYNLTGEQVKFLERLDKRYEADGKYVLTFSDNTMKALESQLMSGLYLPDDKPCFIKIKLSAAGSGGVTLSGEVTESDIEANSPVTAFQPRVRAANFKGGPSGNDGVNIKDLFQMKDGRESLRGVHFDGRDGGSNDRVSNLKVVRDRRTLFDRTNARNRNWLQRNDRAPQAGWYHFYPVAAGYVTEALNTAHGAELDFVLTLSATMTNVPVIVESLEQVRALEK